MPWLVLRLISQVAGRFCPAAVCVKSAVLPLTATSDPNPNAVEDWVVGLPRATLVTVPLKVRLVDPTSKPSPVRPVFQSECTALVDAQSAGCPAWLRGTVHRAVAPLVTNAVVMTVCWAP